MEDRGSAPDQWNTHTHTHTHAHAHVHIHIHTHTHTRGGVQVNCLEDTCGLDGFRGSAPDQWYRAILTNFLHTGVIHYALVQIFQHGICRDVERLAGFVCVCVCV